MTLFERIEAAEAEITTLKSAVAPDLSGLATVDSVTAVKTEVDNLAALVGTPKAPEA